MSEETNNPVVEPITENVSELQLLVNGNEPHTIEAEEGKFFRCRVRFRKHRKQMPQPFAVVVNGERVFCENVSSEIQEVSDYLNRVSTDTLNLPFVLFKANKVVFENQVATIS